MSKIKLHYYLRHSWPVNSELLPTLTIKSHSGNISLRDKPQKRQALDQNPFFTCQYFADENHFVGFMNKVYEELHV